MCDRGKRRKKTFIKAKKRIEIFKTVTGRPSKEYVGELGRFKKDSNLETINDYRKTNSGWYGDKNYKIGDKKRFEKSNVKIEEYEYPVKPDAHEFLYSWD